MSRVYLPNDVILNDILTRVPAKPAIRFKCVSKQWNLFLSSDIFKEMHNRKKDDHQEDHKLFFISRPYNSNSPREFVTINCEEPRNKVPFSRPLPAFDVGADKIRIITSAHGLVCLWVPPDIILWNPLTTEYKSLPHMDKMKSCGLGNGGLYYSSCEDDYKLVLVAKYDGTVYIYSLKSDSWRMVNNGATRVDGWDWKSYVFLTDSLYFLHERKPYSIVRFDTTAVSFQKIETPSVNKPQSATITVHRGYVHYCVKYDIERTSTCIELWKLNVDKVNWEMVVTCELSPKDIRSLCPLHLMRNGNWLMVDYEDECHLFEVDLKYKRYIKDEYSQCHRTIVRRKRNCRKACKLYFSRIGMDWTHHIRYTETFVSPNQYMK